MTRHSKNRTASPHFSYAERNAIAASGTQRARISSEAFRKFDACALCLNPAKDPRVDTKGHLFCNECIISNLIKQKQDLKRQQALVDKMRVEEAAERELALERARERVLEDFERAQQSGGKAKGSSLGSLGNKAVPSVAGVKRKFEVEGDEVEKLVREAEETALKQLEEEQKLSRASKLSSNYWLASNTPEAAPTRLEDVKLQTLCHASKPHPLTLKMLSEVHFDIDQTSTKDEPVKMCWSCRRTLTNNSKVHVIRPCGHALCGECASLGKESKTCPKCSKAADAKDGFIELAREGTGFAAAGGSEVKRFDLAFQG